MPKAFRARYIIPLRGEPSARGRRSLYAPLECMEDAVLLTAHGQILGLESFADFSRRPSVQFALTDFGEACLVPGLINAHCHLELSHLAGNTAQGGGFANWLSSLVPLLHKEYDSALVRSAITHAIEDAFACGTAHIGDVTSRLPLEISAIAASLAKSRALPYPVTHFLEAIGFTPNKGIDSAEGYSPLCVEAIPEDVRANFAIAGHALYSTSPKALQAAYSWSRKHGRIFSLHLAESEQEQECLMSGCGALHDIMRASLLPKDWLCPGMGAVDYAVKLQLLSMSTLAVHCVHISDNDMRHLSLSGAYVCLCPRSNEYIGVGRARASAMVGAGVNLCLGTDGLSSNHNLDMQQEMLAALRLYDIPGRALLRMATINGAEALRLRQSLGSFAAGKAAAWCVLEPELAAAVLAP